jgi:nicotinamidase/pyrazinamidase
MGNKSTRQLYPLSDDENNNKKFILGIIDPQNDFCKGGALAVDDADLIMAPINKLRFACFDHVDTFISQDYHNSKHMSFGETHSKENNTKVKLHLPMEDGTSIDVEQMMWPVHCVEQTFGSQFHQDLIVVKTDKIIKKGTKKNVESYSAFGDEFGGKYENTKLNEWLDSNKITDIILVGIATDYCVYHTALDSLRYGYAVHIILSCTKGVDKTTTNDALDNLHSKGVVIYDTVDQFFERNKTQIKNQNKKVNIFISL